MSLLDKAPIKNFLRIIATDSNVDVRVQAGGTILLMFMAGLLVVLWALTVIRESAETVGEAKAQMAAMERSYKDQSTYFKIYERRLMDWEGVLLAKGIKLPSDRPFGALGNLQRAVPENEENKDGR